MCECDFCSSRRWPGLVLALTLCCAVLLPWCWCWLQAACRLRPDLEGAFELSIGNADKGLLPLEEISRRVAQFTAAGLPLVVTQVCAAAAGDVLRV